MTCKCPLCDSYIDSLDTRIKCYPESGLLLWHGGHAQLTYNQAVVMDKLLEAWPNAVSSEQLIMHYYIKCRHKDDPPGDENVKVILSLLRKALRQQGAPVEIPPVRVHGTGYRVKFTSNLKKAAA